MPRLKGRTDLIALWGGIIFSLAFTPLIRYINSGDARPRFVADVHLWF